jgi:hypothetical protein
MIINEMIADIIKKKGLIIFKKYMEKMNDI